MPRVQAFERSHNGFQVFERPPPTRQIGTVIPQLQDRFEACRARYQPFFRRGVVGSIDQFGDVVRHPAAEGVRMRILAKVIDELPNQRHYLFIAR